MSIRKVRMTVTVDRVLVEAANRAVASGRASSIRRDDLGKALDVGIAQLDRGQIVESSLDDFMAEINAAVGLPS